MNQTTEDHARNHDIKSILSGQCRFQAKNGEVFQGKVGSIVRQGKNRIIIYFVWLAVQKQNRWFDIDTAYRNTFKNTYSPRSHKIFHSFDFEYIGFYYQEDEERVKFWGADSEVCKFYKDSDHACLETHPTKKGET